MGMVAVMGIRSYDALARAVINEEQHGSFVRFAGPPQPKPIPDGPTHCRSGCGTELTPTRRYAGLCENCVALLMAQNVRRRGEQPKPGWTQIRTYRARNRRGKMCTYLVLSCNVCGATREIVDWEMKAHAPKQCNACRIESQKRDGTTVSRPRRKER